MQIRVVFLEPFLAFLYRAAEFAILSRRQDPWSACGLLLAGCKGMKRSQHVEDESEVCWRLLLGEEYRLEGDY